MKSKILFRSQDMIKPKHGRKKTLLLLSMTMPVAIWLVLLRYIPMIGVTLAFKDFRFYTANPVQNLIQSKWVGLDNFKFLFATTDSWIIIRNTVLYNLLWIVLGLVISVSFAMMLNEITHKFTAKVYQTLMFFPYFLSWVVVSYFVMALLDPTSGLIVKWQLGKFGEATNWYHTPEPWPYILTAANLWKNVGYSTILYLAAITGIDKSQYEAASIDGASKWQQMKYVTLPNLRNMIVILLIMDVGKIFNADFGLFWNVSQAYLTSTTKVLDTYVYTTMMNTSDMGMSTAASLFQNVVGFICIMATNTVVRKIDPDSSLF